MKRHFQPKSLADSSRLQESGAMLLLRSPRLSVSLVLELLDIGDAEFRRMCLDNARIAELLDARRNGTLELEPPDLVVCPGCGDWFLPYGGSRHCSDECRRIARIESGSRFARPSSSARRGASPGRSGSARKLKQRGGPPATTKPT